MRYGILRYIQTEVVMKKAYLLCTRLWVFWVELPLAFLLYVAIRHNDSVPSLVKLYPLIIMAIAAMIFAIIYFFRIMKLSYAEIRYIGLFTSRDSAMINAGKRLIIKRFKRGKLGFILMGHDEMAGFDWLKPEDEEEHKEIALFRGKAFGGDKAISRILRTYGVKSADIPKILNEDGYSKSYTNVTVTTAHMENGNEVEIRFDRTV